MHNLRALICDDMEHVRIAHEHHLQQLGKGIFNPLIALTKNPLEAVAAAKSAVSRHAPFDIAFLDVDFRHAEGANGKDGFWAANEIHKVSPSTVLVMVSSYSTDDNLSLVEKSPFVERFLRRGSFTQKEFLSCCVFALIRTLHREEKPLPPEEVAYTESKAMEKYLKQADHIGPNQNLVIYGETGTGKELTAKRINANAGIALGQENRPLIIINCGGLTPSLLTSELFGYVKGAFTGAHSDTPGLLEKGNGGDIFLDELQNASTELQNILLQVLNNKEFTPVGGKKSRRLNVRFITALNKSPTETKKSGTLKPDLIARLQEGYLVIPPLRDRKGDISPLVDRFKRLAGQADISFSDDALQFLEESAWPTNVRGLRNVVRAAIQNSKIPVITAEALKRLPIVQEMTIEAETEVTQSNLNHGASPGGLKREIDALVQRWFVSDAPLEDPIKSFERIVLSRLWEEDRNFARVARRAKLPVTTLRRKLIEHGIET